MSVSSLILSHAPAVYLKLDETSGAACADASGNGHAATLTGTYTRGAASATGEASTYSLSLNGGYAEIVDHAVFNRGTGDFTIVYWAKTTQTGIVVIFGNAAGFWSGINAGKSTMSIGAGVASVGDVNDGEWHQFAHRRSSGTVSVLVDGVLDSTPTTNTTAFDSTGNVGVGAFESNVGGFNLVGGLDDVAFFTTALSDADILAIYEESLPPVVVAGNPTLTAIGVTGATVTISPTGGSGTKTYQWHAGAAVDFVAGGGNAIAGATTDTLTRTGRTPGTAEYVRVVVTDDTGTSTSSARLVEYGNPPFNIAHGGDSTYRSADPARPNATVPAMVAELLRNAARARTVNSINGAENGSDTGDWQKGGAYYDALIAAIDATGIDRGLWVVDLRLGTNDAQNGVDAATFGSQLSAIVTDLLDDDIGVVQLDYPLRRQPGSHAPTDGNITFDESTDPLLAAYLPHIDALVNGQTVIRGDVRSYYDSAARGSPYFYDGIHPDEETGMLGMAQHTANALLAFRYPGYSTRDLAVALDDVARSAELTSAVQSGLTAQGLTTARAATLPTTGTVLRAQDYTAPDNAGIGTAATAASTAATQATAANTKLPADAATRIGTLPTSGTVNTVAPDNAGIADAVTLATAAQAAAQSAATAATSADGKIPATLADDLDDARAAAEAAASNAADAVDSADAAQAAAQSAATDAAAALAKLPLTGTVPNTTQIPTPPTASQNATAVAAALLTTPGNKLAVNASGQVEASNAGEVDVAAIAAAILADPANKLVTDEQGRVPTSNPVNLIEAAPGVIVRPTNN